MSCPMLIHRVEADLGTPITVEHRGVNVTGWTITARFRKPDGNLYTLTANVTQVGDGSDVPARYNFEFQAGNLTPGDHKFDFHYSAVAIEDYSWPQKNKMTMTVRDA